MIRPRRIIAGVAVATLAFGLSLGAVTTAQAAPAAPAATVPTQTWHRILSMLSPYSPVVMTIDGNYYDTQIADHLGNVDFLMSNAGYETGRHVTVATATNTGIVSTGDFGY